MSESPIKLISRPLLLAWTLWLLIGFFYNLYLDGGLSLSLGRIDREAAEAAARPAVQGMLQSALVGLMLIWPAVRLSQPAPARPTVATAIDLYGLLLVLQLVIWPVRIARIEWSIEQTVALDLVIVAYATAAAIIVDIGRRGGAGRRMLATAGCAGLLYGGMFLQPPSVGAMPWHCPPLVVRELGRPWPFLRYEFDLLPLAAAAAAMPLLWWLVVQTVNSIAGSPAAKNPPDG